MTEETKTPDGEIVTKPPEENSDGEKKEDPPKEEEDVFSFGDEEPKKEDDSSVVKKLREVNRANTSRIKELEKRVSESSVSEDAELGARPKLDDFDFDQEKHATATDTWYAKKTKLDQKKEKAEATQKKLDDDWQTSLNKYNEAKSVLNVSDYEESEERVQESFSEIQLGMIIKGAKSPEKLIYTLGKNPEKLKELAEKKDLTTFAFAVSKLEDQVKVKKRKPVAGPEGKVEGSGGSTTADSQLDKLRADAEESGDYSKVAEYKRKHKL